MFSFSFHIDAIFDSGIESDNFNINNYLDNAVQNMELPKEKKTTLSNIIGHATFRIAGKKD